MCVIYNQKPILSPILRGIQYVTSNPFSWIGATDSERVSKGLQQWHVVSAKEGYIGARETVCVWVKCKKDWPSCEPQTTDLSHAVG
jgi:hypothetical protein